MLAEIVLEGEHGWMHFKFTNDSDQPQFLAKPRALLGEQADSGFLDVYPTAIYQGPVVKRLPYSESELFEIAPGSSVEGDKFHIQQWYRVPTSPRLKVRYHASHPLAGMKQVVGPLTPVKSEWVEIDASTALI